MQQQTRYRRAYAGGTFDLFHAGHVALFRRIRAEVADELVVGLNTDAFATRYKRPPIMTLEERRAVVDACRYVTATIVNIGDEDSRPAILASGADVIVHGDDWVGAALQRQMQLSDAWLATHGIRLHYLPYTVGISARGLLERARALEGVR